MNSQIVKITLATCLFITFKVHAQKSRNVYGEIYESGKKPIKEAAIRFAISGTSSSSDSDGRFRFIVRKPNDTLIISHTAYKTKRILINADSKMPLKIKLKKFRRCS